MEFSVNQIAQLINGSVSGNGNDKVLKLDKIQEATEGSLTFLANPKYEAFLYETKASAVIIGKDFKLKKEVKPTLILVEDAYIGFTKLLEEYQKIINFQKSGVESPSFIGEKCVTGDQIYRGAFSYVGNNVKIGDNVKIYPHAYIGDNVQIGDHTIVYSGVKIYKDSIIGSHCTLHSGAVIGSDGFGFAPMSDGSYKTIPQLGNVILEDHVDVGANTVVDRATLGSTLVRKGVKLDNLIQVAHNVTIGKNTVIASQTGVSGSTSIGENCVIAGQVGIAGHLTIADKTTIGAKSGIIGNILEKGKILFGYISLEKGDFLKSYSIFRKLPDLNFRIKELEKKTSKFGD